MNNFEDLGQIEAYDKAKQVLNDMYETEQGKKFIHHLIYAFSSGIVTHIAIASKSVFDCISKSKLNTVYGSFKDIKNVELKAHLKTIASTKDETEKLEAIKAMEAILKDDISANPKPRLAMKSTLTNKVLGIDEYQALCDFAKDQCKKGNDTIKSMTKYIEYQKGNKPKAKNKKKTKKEVISRTSIGANDELREKLMSVVKS